VIQPLGFFPNFALGYDDVNFCRNCAGVKVTRL
jgi:hypothetical protein